MAVAASAAHTIAVGEFGNVFTCGFGNYGQSFFDDTRQTLVPTRVDGLPAPVRQVAAGYLHTGMVTEAGDLLMCGFGRHGQLGLGDEEDRATPTLVARALFAGEALLMVACGTNHTVVATEDGAVYTFGSCVFSETQFVPTLVPTAGFNGERVVMVAAGDMHTVALSEAGHVFTWGYGIFGRLGHGDEKTQIAPRQVAAGAFGHGDKVVFVAARRRHTLAVTTGGRLYTWGDGYRGRLGHGDTNERLVPTLVRAGAFGAPEGGGVVTAACGSDHTLVVTQDGALWACGRGLDGQLGLNDEADRHAFERVGAGAFGGARVAAVAAGDMHSVAVTEDGALWTWGQGLGGRLGHGDVENRLVPTEAVGHVLARFGRFQMLPEEHALAIAMGTHGRLGVASPFRYLEGEVGLIVMIAGFSNNPGDRLAGLSEGICRLLGGGRHFQLTNS